MSGIRQSSVPTISSASVAASTARSISAAVDSAWNWRSSRPAIALNDSASSSSSSPLRTVTRLAKSRSAMRRVPCCSACRGVRLRRIWSLLTISTSTLASITTSRNMRVKLTIGPSTSSRDWLSTRLQTGPEKTSSR
jgi:hypothetical protein